MKIYALDEKPDVALANSLSKFESQFLYPLGETRKFRIDHGEDYSLFFRAMGRGCCFIFEQKGIILGVMCVALKELLFPEGSLKTVMYLGDLKIAPEARGGYVFFRLFQALKEWSLWDKKPFPAFSVVMEGNALTPKDYTGRAGIPRFEELAKIMIVRIPCPPQEKSSSKESTPPPSEKDHSLFRHLITGHYSSGWTRFSLRSQMEPQWFTLPENLACGLLEDTRRAKRLIDDQGEEMLSAHLSYFAYRDPLSGQKLLDQVLTDCSMRQVPFLFVSIPLPELSLFQDWLTSRKSTFAPASIYGTHFPAKALWQMNTSEI
ncbi:MAG: N-acetyltransferase [Planctomycetota bacterium]